MTPEEFMTQFGDAIRTEGEKFAARFKQTSYLGCECVLLPEYTFVNDDGEEITVDERFQLTLRFQVPEYDRGKLFDVYITLTQDATGDPVFMAGIGSVIGDNLDDIYTADVYPELEPIATDAGA